jgi:hypothetical protein
MVFAVLHEPSPEDIMRLGFTPSAPKIDRGVSSFPKENPASRYRKILHKSFCSYEAVTMDAMRRRCHGIER